MAKQQNEFHIERHADLRTHKNGVRYGDGGDFHNSPAGAVVRLRIAGSAKHQFGQTTFATACVRRSKKRKIGSSTILTYHPFVFSASFRRLLPSALRIAAEPSAITLTRTVAFDRLRTSSSNSIAESQRTPRRALSGSPSTSCASSRANCESNLLNAKCYDCIFSKLLYLLSKVPSP